MIDVSCTLPPGQDIVDHARLAEALGYRRIWLYDSPALYRDVWVALTEVAMSTTTIGLGASVLVPGLRHPVATAAAVAGIEDIAPGRLAVAVGTGFTGRRALGLRPHTWAEVAEWVTALRGLLAGETVEFEGAVLRMLHGKGWAPARPLATPVLIAANGPMGIDAAHRLGDGIMTMGAAVPGFAWCASTSGGTVLEPGEDPASPRVFETMAPHLALALHYTWEVAGEAVDNLPGGAGWRLSIEAVPEHERHLAVHEGHLVALNEHDRAHVGPALLGPGQGLTPADVRTRMADLEAGGCTEAVYGASGPDVARELTAWARALDLPGRS